MSGRCLLTSAFICEFFLVLTLQGCVGANKVSEVVILDSDNFERLTKDSVWFINFYAPWCGHCKRAMPLWEETANRLKGSQIRVGKIDADAETELGETFQIQGFPTFKIIEGSHTVDYRGEHTVESFVKFAKEYKPKTTRSAPMTSIKLSGLISLKAIRELLEAFASESLLLYTGCVFSVGLFMGIAIGILLALREKAKFD